MAPDEHEAEFFVSKELAEECQRQSRLLSDDPAELNIVTWLEEASDFEEWRKD